MICKVREEQQLWVIPSVPNYLHRNVGLRIISAGIPHFENSSSVLFLLQPPFQHSLSRVFGAVQNHFCGHQTSFSTAVHFFQFVHRQQTYLNPQDISGKLKRKTLHLFWENKEGGARSVAEPRWLFKILILMQKGCWQNDGSALHVFVFPFVLQWDKCLFMLGADCIVQIKALRMNDEHTGQQGGRSSLLGWSLLTWIEHGGSPTAWGGREELPFKPCSAWPLGLNLT